VKLVAVLRDPVDRAVSDHHMCVRNGVACRPMLEAFEAEMEKAVGETPRTRAPRYLAPGLYAEHIEHWWRWFDPSQLLVLDALEVTRGSTDGYARLLDFLGVDAWWPGSFAEYGIGSYLPAEAVVRARLARYFTPHNERLWELLGVRWDWTAPDSCDRGGGEAPPRS
jgi:lipopolysaccharide transport system ATP-binding protein